MYFEQRSTIGQSERLHRFAFIPMVEGMYAKILFHVLRGDKVDGKARLIDSSGSDG
jgi:hypothetical protein